RTIRFAETSFSHISPFPPIVRSPAPASSAAYTSYEWGMLPGKREFAVRQYFSALPRRYRYRILPYGQARLRKRLLSYPQSALPLQNLLERKREIPLPSRQPQGVQAVLQFPAFPFCSSSHQGTVPRPEGLYQKF